MQQNSLGQNIVTGLFYAALAIAVLLAADFHSIGQFFSSHVLGNNAASNINYSSFSSPISSFLDKFSAPTLMVFWALVGLGSYTLAIWIQTAFVAVHKEAKEAAYVRPASSQGTYWHNTMTNNLSIAGLIIGWIVSLYVFVQVLLPRFSKLLNHSLNAGTFWHRLGYLVGAIILTAVCLYLIVSLSRLLKRGWRRFSLF